MDQRQAEIIALSWLCGWASLPRATTEDFYDYISPLYLKSAGLVPPMQESPAKGLLEEAEYEATEEERLMMSKIFQRETNRLLKRMNKLGRI